MVPRRSILLIRCPYFSFCTTKYSTFPLVQLNISEYTGTTGRFGTTLGTDINCSQMINPNDSDDPLTSHLVPA